MRGKLSPWPLVGIWGDPEWAESLAEAVVRGVETPRPWWEFGGI